MENEKYSTYQLSISAILGLIEANDIAIPEIQRPFVWKKTQVRDLIDSLYRGYPTGYVILWKNPNVKLKDGTISSGKKVLIDGQQRITAMMTAIAGRTVFNSEYQEERIKIAFNPLAAKDNAPDAEIFAVSTPAIQKSVLNLFKGDIKYHVNPTGKFVIGGPHGDTGLTGRKIIVDTYGGKGAHGGGAFSGKDPSKVDRSAAYAARHIAKNMVAAGVADEMLVQVSYAIGVAEPINIYVNTYGHSNVKMSDGDIAKKIEEIFDMRPKAIEERLKLRNPIYEETAAYGHMGRKPEVVTKHFDNRYEGARDIQVELFTWEKLDYVDRIRQVFGI